MIALILEKNQWNTKKGIFIEKTFDDIADICYKENQESELISVSIIVKDRNSGEIHIYNSNEYGGISEYVEN